MAVIRVPPELLRRIFDEAQEGLYTCSSDENFARSIALTCRAWRAHGTALFHRKVSLYSDGSGGAQHLLRFPHLAPLVTAFSYNDWSSTPTPPPSFLPALALCTSLRILTIVAGVEDICTVLSVVPFPHLEVLSISSRTVSRSDRSKFDPRTILADLSRIPTLQKLDNVTKVPHHERTLADIDSVCLPQLKNFSLQFDGHTDSKKTLSAYLSALPTARLETLRIACGKELLEGVLDFAAGCTALKHLAAGRRSADPTPHLIKLADMLPGLSQLQALDLGGPSEKARPPPPQANAFPPAPDPILALSTFLDALPPSLRTCTTSLVFPLGPACPVLTTFLRDRLRSPLVEFTYRGLYTTGYGGSYACHARKELGEDGRPKWINQKETARWNACSSCYEDMDAYEHVYDIDEDTREVPRPRRRRCPDGRGYVPGGSEDREEDDGWEGGEEDFEDAGEVGGEEPAEDEGIQRESGEAADAVSLGAGGDEAAVDDQGEWTLVTKGRPRGRR
ncbi:hypothetical protein JCM10450v2_002916 [Rhodotorula kratochvilovae]